MVVERRLGLPRVELHVVAAAATFLGSWQDTNRMQARSRCTTQTPAVNLSPGFCLPLVGGSGMPKCGVALPVVKAKPFGWPSASLDLGCGRHRVAAMPE